MVSERSKRMKGIVSHYMDFCIYSTEMEHYWRIVSRGITGSGLSFRRFTLRAVWRMTVMGQAS